MNWIIATLAAIGLAYALMRSQDGPMLAGAAPAPDGSNPWGTDTWGNDLALADLPIAPAAPTPEAFAATPEAPATVLETIQAQVQTAVAQARVAVFGSPADSYSTSEAMQTRLRKREGLRLQRYRLGDGGWTIGYGRFYPDGGELPPEAINRDTAESWFKQDLAERGEKWVKLYVTVPISQGQFDALTSMAYNLSPKSFRRIAEAVNAGQDPEPIAKQYTRPGTNLEKGLIARRDEELGIFNGTLQA